MAIERSRSRMLFQQEEVVQLKRQCFTLGRVFEPGKYLAGELPNEAFEMGLVESLPPVRGKAEQLPPTTDGSSKHNSPTQDDVPGPASSDAGETSVTKD